MFRHAFAQLPVVDSIPFLDELDGESGGRFALADTIRQDTEDGEIVTESKLLELRRRELSQREREDRAIHKSPVPTRGGLAQLSEQLSEVAENRAPEEMLQVSVRLHEPAGAIQIKRELARKVAVGEIQSWAEHQAARAALKQQQAAEVATEVGRVGTLIQSLGGRVVSRCTHMYCLEAALPAGSLREFSESKLVLRVEGSTDGTENIDGIDIFEGHQLEHFLPSNGADTTSWSETARDGQNRDSAAGTTPVHVAVVEFNGPDIDHPGFFEWSSLTDSRIDDTFNCNSGTCSSGTLNQGGHASAVAGLFIGDLRDEQDNSFGTGLGPEQAHSGYSGEADGYMYEVSATGTGSITAGLNHIVSYSASTVPTIVNMSIGWPSDDTTCVGTSNLSAAANSVFEDGKLLVFAAGNDGGSTTNCAVESPGSALGVFTVGSLGQTDSGGDYTTIRSSVATDVSNCGGSATRSAWGGGADGRSIIDAMAFGCRENVFDTTGGYRDDWCCGTSFAAPTYAAALTNFTDWYINTSGLSDIRDEPGFIFANGLLFGDRYNGSSKATAFHDRYGAGRLMARRYSSAGMDGPYEYSSGTTCISDNEVYTIDVNNGNWVSSDVDDFKAVIWWYDGRHDSGNGLDDLDLRLLRNGVQVSGSFDSSDNKERVYASDVGNGTLELEISGYDVTTSGEGICNNAMQVWWAYFYEDDDRDDSDGPTAAQVAPE